MKKTMTNKTEDNILSIFNNDDISEIKQNEVINNIDLKKLVNKHDNLLSAINELISLLPFTNKINQSITSKIKELTEIFDKKNSKFVLSWKHICNRIGHELFKKLQWSIEAIIDNENYNIAQNDFTQKTINNLLNILSTKRNVPKQQKNYLLDLINRSKQFIPIRNVKNISYVRNYVYLNINYSLIN